MKTQSGHITFLTPAAVTVLLLVLVVGCSKKPTGPGGNYVPRYMIETEPTLSPDRQWVYFIANDTATPANSGIYRARISAPIRELVLAESGLHSPTVAPDNARVAFLKAGKLHYYDMRTDVQTSSSVTRSFSAITFMSNSTLAGHSADSIYLIDESAGSSTFLAEGREVTRLDGDRIMYVVSIPGYAFGFVEYRLSNSSMDSLYFVSVLDNSGMIHWPSLDPGSGRVAYVHSARDKNTVYAGQIGATPTVMLTESTNDRSLIIRSNKIIFTGSDGRLWESDYAGTDIAPWWHAQE